MVKILKFISCLALMGLSFSDCFGQYEDLNTLEFLKLEELGKDIALDTSFNYELVEQGIMHVTNLYRTRKSRLKLEYNTSLYHAAQLHSTQMKIYDFFDHINRKNKLLKDLDDRAKVANYSNFRELSENLYYGFIDLRTETSYIQLIETIVRAFQSSKSHNQNLLKKELKEMGASIIFKSQPDGDYLYYYLTQSFGTRF